MEELSEIESDLADIINGLEALKTHLSDAAYNLDINGVSKLARPAISNPPNWAQLERDFYEIHHDLRGELSPRKRELMDDLLDALNLLSNSDVVILKRED